LNAQAINNQIKDVVMPSPNAASLGKYGDIPVSYNTGIPSVGIPIHTLSEGSISLPISLGYHAGGIKVGEPASWIGQNWSLQAGGMISRTVQGRADESCGGFFTIGKDVGVTGNCVNETTQFTNSELANGVKDGEPDIFSFSIGGYSGKFYIAADLTNDGITNGQVVLIPKQDVKISYTATASSNCSNVYRLQRFTIITPDGVKYEFGSDGSTTDAIEITRNNESSFWQASGWYLKKITSADGVNTVTVNYTQEEYRYTYKTSSGTAPSLINSWPLNSPSGSYPQNGVDVIGFRLKDIQTSTDKVTFVAGAERTVTGGDLAVNPNKIFPTVSENPKRLDRIKIENGSMCKSFILTQSYFEDNDAANRSGQFTNYRLRLDNVQERSCDGTKTIPAHIFTYHNNPSNPNYLPNRLSAAIDHWGYYNGALTNQHNGTNMPYTRLKYFNPATSTQYPNGRNFDVKRGESNRETNEANMLLGTLKTINYPTGGSTTFEYEANDYYDPQGIKQLTNVNNITAAWPDGNCAANLVSPNTLLKTFTTTELADMFYQVETQRSNYYTATCADYSPTYQIKVYVGSTSTSVLCSATLTASSAILSGNGGVGTIYKKGIVSGKLTELLPCLQANMTYRFEIVTTNSAVSFTLQQEITVGTNINRKVGGLRVKKITNNDAVNVANNVVKTYTYGSPNSTGVLYGKPVYGYVYSGQLGQCNAGVPATAYNITHFFMEQSIVPLGSFEGSHINYDVVRENYVVNNVPQYYSVYKYFNEAAPVFAGLPLTPTQARIGSGELTRKEQYTGTNGLVASDDYTPYADSKDSSAGYYIKFNTYLVNGDGTAISLWKNYNIKTRAYRMGQTTSYLDGITTSTNYAYDPNLLPKRSETVTNSNGASTTSTYYYASDDPTNCSALITRNMIGFPVKVKQKTGNAARWSKVEYDVFNGSTQIEPKYLKESFEDVPTTWITRVTIAAYTTNGMPSTVTKNNFSVAENYAWTNKLLTQKTFGTGANLLTWGIAYKAGTSLVEKVTDENGLIKKYTYDPLMRLQTVQDRMKDDGTDVQTTTNYTYQYKDVNNAYSYIGTSMSFANTTGAAPLSTKQYMDGLGRAISMVKENYTHGDNLNQINNVAYDALGRQYRTYLPFTSNGSQATAGYVETGFETSPLSRPISHRNTDGTYKYMSYSTNTAADAVQIFTPTTALGMVASAASSSTYAANLLYKTTITDENSKIACVFKDRLGRVILTRKFLNGATGANVDTYNVYDDFSQLVVVLPPGSVVGSGTVSISNELTFQYKYDSRNRLTEKKIPGAEWQKIYYDDRDLVTLTQDGNMRTPASGGAADKYLATQYDEIGRVLRTGWVTTADPVNFAKSGFTIPDGVNKLTETIYYSNRTWVKHQGARVLKPAGVATATEFVWSYSERRVGLEYTGNPVWQGKQHLRFAAVSQMPITDSDVNGVDWVVSGYNGLQQPDLTIRYVFEGNGSDAKTWQSFTYDNGRRLTDIKFNYATGGAGISSPTYTLSNMVYNFKDQLIEKNIGLTGTSALQSVDYIYNIRGFLTNINNVALYTNGSASIMTPPMNGTSPIQNLAITPFVNKVVQDAVQPYRAANAMELPPVNDNNADLYSQNITYGDPASQTGAAAQNNGNISSTTWQVLGRAKQAYGFTYDGLDRLSVANYLRYY
jgi:hypothetical protein